MAALAVATIGVLKRKRRDPVDVQDAVDVQDVIRDGLELQKLEYEIDGLKQENQWLKTRLGGLSRIAPTLASFVSLAALVSTFVVAFATWQTAQSALKKASSDIVIAETKEFSDLIQTASDVKNRSSGERIGAIWALDRFWSDENIRDAPNVLSNALTEILIQEPDESRVVEACEGVISRAYQGVKDPLMRRQITASLYGSQTSTVVGPLLTQWKRLVKQAEDPANGSAQKRLCLARAIITTAGNLKYGDLRGANLALITLEGLDFSRVDLSSATLTEATLSGTNLQSADLQHANLQSADLKHANLQYAKLNFADLQYANLQSADLQHANLESANLQSATFNYANLQRADLRSANLQSANLDFFANLQHADLQYATLESAILRSADLRSADLQHANLNSAVLQHADLRSAKLQSAKLQGANLIDARLEGADLEGADLEGAKVADPMDLKGVKGTFGGKVIFGRK